MAKLGKRLKSSYELVNKTKLYELSEAVKTLKSFGKAKFDETIDIVVALGVDPRHADQLVRGVVDLPHGTGKKIKVAVFAKGDKAKEALDAGADYVGSEDLMKKIQDGLMDFDRCIATPDMMGVVGRLGKVLGPRGLMPNPKLGTVTVDINKAVSDAKAGQVQFRVEKAGIVHAGIGKASFDEKQIAENVLAFMKAIARAKPTGAKGTYMKSCSISTTMGPGIKLSIGSLPLAD